MLNWIKIDAQPGDVPLRNSFQLHKNIKIEFIFHNKD